MTLAEQVLERFAKSSPHKYLNWKEQKDSLIFEDETWGEFVIEEIERAISLALSVKQAEVLKMIEELECMHVIDKALEKEDYSGTQEEAFEHGWTETLDELKKRLLEKAVEEKE